MNYPKKIFDLCSPNPSAAAWLKDRERLCYLLCPCFGRNSELPSRLEAYLLTHLLLKFLVPISRMQARVSQPKHAQLLQVTLMMKNKWELLLACLTLPVRKPSRYEVDSSLPKATRESYTWHLVTFPGDCMLLFNAMPVGWVMAWTTHLRKYTHNTAKLLQMKEHALSLNIQISTNL